MCARFAGRSRDAARGREPISSTHQSATDPRRADPCHPFRVGSIAVPIRLHTVRAMTHNHYPTDPAHTFLSSKEVIARYGWGRTKGYQVLAGSEFPRAIAGRYRLDTLIAWEDGQPAAEATPEVDASTGMPRRPVNR
jgi:hypothetical protein